MPTSARRIALLALVIAYVWVIESLGFTLTTFTFVFAAIVLLSSLANWKRALIISLSCSIIGYIVFIYFFQTRFPKGLIENAREIKAEKDRIEKVQNEYPNIAQLVARFGFRSNAA